MGRDWNPYLQETWEILAPLGMGTFVIGLIALVVLLIFRPETLVAQVIGAAVVVLCGLMSVVGGSMLIGKVDRSTTDIFGLPDIHDACPWMGDAAEYTACNEQHYSLTGYGVAGIVCGLALAGFALLLIPLRRSVVRDPRDDLYHSVVRDPRDDLYWCRGCNFWSFDPSEAKAHGGPRAGATPRLRPTPTSRSEVTAAAAPGTRSHAPRT